MTPTTIYSATEGKKFAGDTELVVVTCNTCFVTYAIPESLRRSALRWRGDRPDGRGWKICCPMGHTWWYVGETDEEVLRRRLIEQQRRTNAERDLREHTERQLRSQKGATTKAKKRHAAGVCPACNRTFSQLVAHMAEKHPDYKPDSS